jgi:hypothetical protein
MPVQLRSSTGIPKIDSILEDIVGQFEKNLPNCIVGYYLIGSYADGSAVSLSDVDLYVVLRDSMTEVQETAAFEISRQQAEKNVIRLDFVLRRQAALVDDSTHGMPPKARACFSRASCATGRPSPFRCITLCQPASFAATSGNASPPGIHPARSSAQRNM